MFHNEPRPKRRRKLALVEAESAAPAPAAPGVPLLNRELSWLAFNERVLDEAFDERWPLLERLKFLCITETNLDEFFMIRVSGLLDQLSSEVVEPSDDGLPPAEALVRIRADVQNIEARQTACLARTSSRSSPPAGSPCSRGTRSRRSSARARRPTSGATSSRSSRRSPWTRATRSRSSRTSR